MVVVEARAGEEGELARKKVSPSHSLFSFPKGPSLPPRLSPTPVESPRQRSFVRASQVAAAAAAQQGDFFVCALGSMTTDSPHYYCIIAFIPPPFCRPCPLSLRVCEVCFLTNIIFSPPSPYAALCSTGTRTSVRWLVERETFLRGTFVICEVIYVSAFR